MDAVLAVGGQVIVDNQGYLLDINSSGEQVGGDEDTGGARAELTHNEVTLLLVHVSVHRADREVLLRHVLGEPVHLSAGVAVDDRLGDGQGRIQVTEGVELPLLLLDGNVELLDTLQSKLVLLHQNAHGVAHELGGHLQHVKGHRGGEDGTLDGFRKKFEDVVDLLFKSTRKHLIGLIEHEELDGIELQRAALDHIEGTSRSAHHNVDSVLESADVVPDGGSSHTRVDLDVHEVAERSDDLDDLLGELASGRQDEGLALPETRIDALQNTNRKGGSLTSTYKSRGRR